MPRQVNAIPRHQGSYKGKTTRCLALSVQYFQLSNFLVFLSSPSPKRNFQHIPSHKGLEQGPSQALPRHRRSKSRCPIGHPIMEASCGLEHACQELNPITAHGDAVIQPRCLGCFIGMAAAWSSIKSRRLCLGNEAKCESFASSGRGATDQAMKHM